MLCVRYNTQTYNLPPGTAGFASSLSNCITNKCKNHTQSHFSPVCLTKCFICPTSFCIRHCYIQIFLFTFECFDAWLANSCSLVHKKRQARRGYTVISLQNLWWMTENKRKLKNKRPFNMHLISKIQTRMNASSSFPPSVNWRLTFCTQTSMCMRERVGVRTKQVCGTYISINVHALV